MTGRLDGGHPRDRLQAFGAHAEVEAADTNFRITALAGDPRSYAWLGLVIAIVCVFKAVPYRATHMWVSSDTLWPVDLFIDIFRDGYSFRGWEFSIAPCWFPDVDLVGLCYLFVKDPILATFAAGGIQFIILIAGFCLCWRALKLNSIRLLDMLTVATAIALTIWMAFHTDTYTPGFFRFYLPQTHVGNLVMHVYAIWLTLLLIDLPPGRKRMAVGIGFAMVCWLAGLSNLMFFPHTVAPLLTGILALAVAGALPIQQAAIPVAIGPLATVAGAAFYRFFFTAMSMGAQSSTGYDARRTALHTFFSGFTAESAGLEVEHVAGALWLAICVIGGIFLLWRVWGRGTVGSNPAVGRALFLIVSACAAVFGPAILILGGSNGLTIMNNYVWTMHYLHPTFLLPFLAWPALIGMLPTVRMPQLAVRGAVFLAAAISLIAPAVVFARFRAVPLTDYVPEFVRVLDREAGRYGIKNGIASYWQARLINLLSRTGLRAVPVNESIQPFTIVANSEWFTESLEDKAQKPCLSFILLNEPLFRITRLLAVSLEGVPSNETNAAGVPVLIYADATRADATRADATRANASHGQSAPTCLRFPPAVGEVSNGSLQMIRPLAQFASSTTSSVMKFRSKVSEAVVIPVQVTNTSAEPWSNLGTFPVNLSYRWFRAGQMLPIEGKRTTLPGTVAPGEAVSLAATVVAPDEPGSYVLRVSLVQEGVAWFMSKGAPPLDIPAVVLPKGAGQEPGR
jgi:hypothetical protein